jgi:N-methylhydantoinase A
MTYRIAADIGGTFTDLVLLDERGTMRVDKTPSTPNDFTRGVLRGVARILDGGDLHAVDTFVHGATVVLNALLQLRLPRTALVTTRGFRDVLEIMRTNNPRMYDLQYVKPQPLVPRELRLEVSERVRHTGEVLVPLDEADVRRAARELAESEVAAVAVCLLHAYANPTHERRVGAILAEEMPDARICLSSEVAPEWREFERTSTTCVNAATTPIIEAYLQRLATQLQKEGLQHDLLVMQSSGGVMTSAAACRWPVRTVMSGPSGGVVGALELARELGLQNVVTIDIGGTSSDMGVIAGGRAITVDESTVGNGWPILAPMIEILSIGAGGGSIAWLDRGGALRVGPQSAGADPAPVCYGRGGTKPTVTDANLVLGLIDPEYFLGGEMALDINAARAALEQRVAEPLGLDLLEAAYGIVRIVNTTMARAMRSILIERGHDPRDYVLMAFGGCGGLHAGALLRELGIPRALVPNNPGALSAIGMLGTDFRHDRARTLVRALDELDYAEVERTFAELEEEATTALRNDGVGHEVMVLSRSVDLRYVGQEYSLNVAWSARDGLGDAFHVAHRRVYGYATPEFDVQLVGLRVVAVGRTGRLSLPRIAARRSGALEPGRVRAAVFDGSGFVETPSYHVDDLCAGDRFAGPAIVEDPRSTMLVLPGQFASVDEWRNLQIEEAAT